MEFAKWGFLPFWSKDPKKIKPMINAKSETIADSRLFKHSFAKKRCIIPADSFYEWKKSGNGKIPMRILLKDHSIFGFAGIFDESKDAEGNVIRTCSIITTQANNLVSDVHDRMPVILPYTAESLWLDNRHFNAEELKQIMQPFPSELMEMYPVSNFVNSVKNNSPACLEPRGDEPEDDAPPPTKATRRKSTAKSGSESNAALESNSELGSEAKENAPEVQYSSQLKIQLH
jgi:putative SOS response-associated peptidase YedK